ncbi:MAG: hydroxyacid dehydrogenase [Clostridia bacterium]|nr:hydroxyacid dehydrogenase [Clostridia bacterium]
MKIALILNNGILNDLFTSKAIDKLRTLGEVAINPGEPTIENIKETIKGADIAITSWGNPLMEKEILDECPNLKLLMHAAGSVKPVVTDELWNRGIRVCASTKPLGMGVAETALAFAIAACKNFFELNDIIHNGGYELKNIKEFYELTVGVVSAGYVGRHMIKLLQNFGVEVLLYDPYVTDAQAEEMGCTKAELNELLEKSDVVSLHAPSIPATNHMINADTLRLMKKDAVLINTARGSVVDEKALYEHMAAGNLKYACLDVYDPEPIEADNPLRTLKNVIMTPHIAGLAANGKLRIGAHSAEQIEHFIKGEALECEVTKEMLDTIA